MRVKALKGEGKTTSRKARKSGRASGTSSPGGSDILHKVFHQGEAPYRSESEATPPQTPPALDEEGEWLDGVVTPPEDDNSPFDTQQLLSELRDRKANHNETRELLLEHYVKTLRNRYSDEYDNLDYEELFEAFLRSANRGSTPKERCLSLEAYSVTATVSSVTKVDAARTILKQIFSDDDDEDCQIQALYALCLTVVIYGGGEEDTCDFLDWLVEIIQSNGETVNAINKDGVMVAVFECWAFAATHVNIWAQADYTMDAFVDKLDSTDTDTQAAAAECIAYIFEASRVHEAEEGEPFELPYDPARIASRLKSLNKGSVKSMSKKDRRDLRESLRSVVTSLEKGVGPYYSTSQESNTGREYGYRFKLRKGEASSSYGTVAVVESWYHLHRINMLRNILQNGMKRHLEHENSVVVECLDGLDWELVQKTSKSHRTQGDLRFDFLS